jgi:hypothetical protein
MRGASLRAVGELLGHQTMQMTLRYAHLSPRYLSAEIGLLDRVGDEKDAKRRDLKRAKKRGNVLQRAYGRDRRWADFLRKLVSLAGLEPATSWFVG